ncbi:hypothetical protein NDU88_001441 [Pleurodeles waltl]|uniref:Uncharacterized protein n=1 Tax=Pleurodeles waltl TaxID=8319 RepID=A0AAV7TIB6_PLEWA|nr:hypothetical protein NDU88_001441 [Pleurodeles waltl]
MRAASQEAEQPGLENGINSRHTHARNKHPPASPAGQGTHNRKRDPGTGNRLSPARAVPSTPQSILSEDRKKNRRNAGSPGLLKHSGIHSKSGYLSNYGIPPISPKEEELSVEVSGVRNGHHC